MICQSLAFVYSKHYYNNNRYRLNVNAYMFAFYANTGYTWTSKDVV